MKGLLVSDTSANLREAESLWESLGGEVIGTHLFVVKKPNPRHYLGRGHLSQLVLEGADILYCDLPISPVNRRELEKTLEVEVWDRTEVVLRIFNERAQTAEGKLQVRLANLMHQKRKLVGAWKHLERQRGALGKIGGPGELQKEMDRRLLDNEIERIKKKLVKIKNQRKVRRRSGSVALVGYTNAGKTSALRLLTRDSIEPSSKLFATLDPRTRYWHLGSGVRVPLVDTVGFVLNLPSLLIEAFHATLEEAAHASVVLHLHDLSDPEYAKKGEYVSDTLQKLGVDLRRVIQVWNKCDLSNSKLGIEGSEGEGFAASCATGEGWESVRDAVKQKLGIKLRRLLVRDHQPSETLPPCLSCKHTSKGLVMEFMTDEAGWRKIKSVCKKADLDADRC